MHTIHAVLVYLHIAAGSVALLLFWVPALTKKGGKLHVSTGRFYVAGMHIVAITAFVASIIALIDPIAIRRPGEIVEPEQAAQLAQRFRMFSLFLLMLSVLVFTSVRHGIAALTARRDPEILAKPLHRMTIAVLGLLGIIVGAIGIGNRELLLIVFAGISVSGAVGMFRDTLKTAPKRGDLIVAHLNGLIGSGIGAHTAFFAFGGSRFLSEILPGQWQLIPWIAPAVVGTVVIARVSRRYRPSRARQAV